MPPPNTLTLESESQVIATKWAGTKPAQEEQKKKRQRLDTPVEEAKEKVQPVQSPKAEQKKMTQRLDTPQPERTPVPTP